MLKFDFDFVKPDGSLLVLVSLAAVYVQVQRRLGRQGVMEQPLRADLASPDGLNQEIISTCEKLLQDADVEVRYLNNLRELCKCLKSFTPQDMEEEVTKKGSFAALFLDGDKMMGKRLMENEKTFADMLHTMARKLQEVLSLFVSSAVG